MTKMYFIISDGHTSELFELNTECLSVLDQCKKLLLLVITYFSM